MCIVIRYGIMNVDHRLRLLIFLWVYKFFRRNVLEQRFFNLNINNKKHHRSQFLTYMLAFYLNLETISLHGKKRCIRTVNHWLTYLISNIVKIHSSVMKIVSLILKITKKQSVEKKKVSNNNYLEVITIDHKCHSI